RAWSASHRVAAGAGGGTRAARGGSGGALPSPRRAGCRLAGDTDARRRVAASGDRADPARRCPLLADRRPLASGHRRTAATPQLGGTRHGLRPGHFAAGRRRARRRSDRQAGTVVSLPHPPNLAWKSFSRSEYAQAPRQHREVYAMQTADVPTCGVILAGGKGTRLGELTRVTNKHLLPVGPMPMVYHPLRKLVGAGIADILLISGTDHMGDFVELLGSGREHGCQLTYRVQDEAGGIAQALGLAEHFCRGCRSVVLLGDNIFEDPLGPFLRSADARPDQAWLFLKQVADPQRYGVAEITGETIVNIVEKPA